MIHSGNHHKHMIAAYFLDENQLILTLLFFAAFIIINFDCEFEWILSIGGRFSDCQKV